MAQLWAAGAEVLGGAADRDLADEADVYVYFNNNPGGAAVINSARFAALAGQSGHTVTRTSGAGDVAATTAVPTW